MANIQHIKTIREFHRSRALPPPKHPLISLVDYADVHLSPDKMDISWVFDFYSISLKRNLNGKIKYGQQDYDFDEGVMFFISPGQVFSIQAEQQTSSQKSGWILLVHPDFLWNTMLSKNIKRYEYFNYTVHEALFLSDKEQNIIAGITQNIDQELQENIDNFSQQIIISQIESLLNYADRFYHRQFITRKITNHRVLDRLEELLTEYFNNYELTRKGLPTVQFISDSLHVSPSYLRSLLKILTGRNTKQHIHEKLIAKAKEKLSTTNLSISEIAYELGFERPQSFSKLFKSRTDLSPLEFRHSFN
ncbi:MAG TPA: helix-turn-helix transcriptional regulator [Puia sp.]|nr:helix-turn-helix transcriptional regulator [Puia sp.]